MFKEIARALCPPLVWQALAHVRAFFARRRLPRPIPVAAVKRRTPPDFVQEGIRKAHYGSADRFLDGWANLDLVESEDLRYMKSDLTQRHPFPDNWLSFGFAEDFLEHLDQEQSLRFLIEAHRTLALGGALRLSFPGLEGVLKKHYRNPTLAVAELARSEAYDMWGHKHFYSPNWRPWPSTSATVRSRGLNTEAQLIRNCAASSRGPIKSTLMLS